MSECAGDNVGEFVFAMDALFGLPRKKSAGTSYRNPLHEELFFCEQLPVDEFVEESTQRRKTTSTFAVSNVDAVQLSIYYLGIGMQ